MAEYIQQVHISDTEDLYILSVDTINKQITYQIINLNKEKTPLITSSYDIDDKQMINVDEYYFSMYFLNKFINK